VTVHPRVCGEHDEAAADAASDFGSSPRVRGTPVVPGRRRGAARFIPACAGNTKSIASALRYASVHPRVCGEHWVDKLDELKLNGSSPRVRGTRLLSPE